MATAQHLISLVKSHLDGNDDQFLSVAMQVAAKEARQGHSKVAQQLKKLVDEARSNRSNLTQKPGIQASLTIRDDLADLLSVTHPDLKLAKMVLRPALRTKLLRVLHEQKQQSKLRSYGLQPRRKLLFVGPPGSGKTMTASAIAGELQLPLFTIRLDGVITKFMGETASKLRQIFEAMSDTKGVYLFDEFDAIGAHRSSENDIGEIRRVLNSFLQFLENDESQGLIIAATNHPELLDQALFRRFDDVVRYEFPDDKIREQILRSKLLLFQTDSIDWTAVVQRAEGLSQAEIARASDEAAKSAILDGHIHITTPNLVSALLERKQANDIE